MWRRLAVVCEPGQFRSKALCGETEVYILGTSFTPVGSDGRASREARFFGCQHHVQGGQLCRLSCSTERRILTELCHLTGKLTPCNLQRRPDRTRRHHVDADTPASQLLG
jgi:hypothetical protein